MENSIEVRHLKKYFGPIKAVDDISFRVREGELFAFLGLNGAGKSTTISIICSMLQKDAGEVRVRGMDIEKNADAVRRAVGIVFQESHLDQLLSVRDNLRMRAALYGITGEAWRRRQEALCRLLELEELMNRPVGKLSGGQRRRIDIARALLHEPEILILDEPTTGLDPQSRKRVWQVVEQLRREKGLTVFLTTHYMEEAAGADTIVILDGGRIAAEGTPVNLKNTYTRDCIRLYGTDARRLQALSIPYTVERDCLEVTVENAAAARALILAHPELFEDFEVVKGRMDDVFLAATGKDLKEDAHA